MDASIDKAIVSLKEARGFPAPLMEWRKKQGRSHKGLISQHLLVQENPTRRKFTMISVDAAAVEAAHALSVMDWHDWLPYAHPPCDCYMLSWDPRPYLKKTHPDLDPGEMAEEITVIGAFGTLDVYLRYGLGLMPSPFYALFKDNRLPPMKNSSLIPVDKSIQSLGWGTAIVDQYGLPEDPVVYGNGVTPLMRLGGDALTALAYETAGTIRAACAMLALMNMHGEPVEETTGKPSGRLLTKRGSIPKYDIREVVIKPFRSVSRPTNKDALLGPKFRKRDHGVRGHWRTYKTGKRVWVHAHRRGDAALGTVAQTYKVEGPKP
jgi:hypothetical protein